MTNPHLLPRRGLDPRHTGRGLLIECQASNQPATGWLCFSSWRSVRRLLPDAEFSIRLPTPIALPFDALSWSGRAGIEVRPPLLDGVVPALGTVHQIKDTQVAIAIDPETRKPVFRNLEAIGSFRLSDWSTSREAPFEDAAIRFASTGMARSDQRVLRLWNSIATTWAMMA